MCHERTIRRCSAIPICNPFSPSSLGSEANDVDLINIGALQALQLRGRHGAILAGMATRSRFYCALDDDAQWKKKVLKYLWCNITKNRNINFNTNRNVFNKEVNLYISEVIEGVDKACSAVCKILLPQRKESGTGFLISPRQPEGWMVLTNQHVIPDCFTVKTALVYFKDQEKPFHTTNPTAMYTGSRIKDRKSTPLNDLDETTLDFTAFFLKTDDDRYMTEIAIPIKHTLSSMDNNFVIILSYPKRIIKISFGHIKVNESGTHAEHTAKTWVGSSGAPLLYFLQYPEPHCVPLFLHYCSCNKNGEFMGYNRAISLDVIMQVIKTQRGNREKFNKDFPQGSGSSHRRSSCPVHNTMVS